MTVMIIGFFILLGLLLVVVVNASGAYVAHRRLVSAADGAAAAAASGLDRQAAYEHGLEAGGRAPLSPSSAKKAAWQYLRAAGITVDSLAVDVRNRRVRVRLSASFHSQLAPPGWPDSSQMVAEASAELQLDGHG